MKKIKILFDANSLMVSRTGIGHYTARLVEHIAHSYPEEIELVGYYYNFLGRKSKPASPAAPNISYRPILALPGPGVNLLRRFGIELPIEFMTLMRADFIMYPNFLSQPSLFRTPSTAVIHDLAYLDFPQYGAEKNVRDLTRFVPTTLRRMSFVTTVSRFSKQRIADHYKVPPSDIITTFNPPTDPVVLSGSKSRQLRTNRGITKPYIHFIGTMEPRKNIGALLEAYTLLPDEVRKKYSFVLAGKVDWKYQETMQKLEKLQAEGHDIRYLGYVDDDERAALYQGSSLFVLASHYEGFGMQILEALHYGVPCAVSNIPVFHEVGGNMVSYFDYKDPGNISDTIENCLAADVDKNTLRSYVTRLPSWSDVSKTVVNRIKATLEGRNQDA